MRWFLKVLDYLGYPDHLVLQCLDYPEYPDYPGLLVLRYLGCLDCLDLDNPEPQFVLDCQPIPDFLGCLDSPVLQMILSAL